jgi:hypothetical protein
MAVHYELGVAIVVVLDTRSVPMTDRRQVRQVLDVHPDVAGLNLLDRAGEGIPGEAHQVVLTLETNGAGGRATHHDLVTTSIFFHLRASSAGVPFSALKPPGRHRTPQCPGPM